MNSEFFKFPSTPHLAQLKNVTTRIDKLLSEYERMEFLSHVVTVEEKIDGANLGISFDGTGNLLTQNRGAYLIEPFDGQWKKLSGWLALRVNTIFDTLSNRYILFGEWCYAKHSITYSHLPDWYLGFDIFDKHLKKFLSAERRNTMLSQMGIHTVPLLGYGTYTLLELKDLFTQSRFGNDPMEGLYLRWDDGDWLGQRAKLVQPHFVQSIGEHWSRRPIEVNQRALDFWQ